ncbi:MAG: MaoC/PaaZ C-terminal domain-containing protein [Methylobacterium sp.]
MPDRQVAEKHFTQADQERFAALSGDRNPMHMDALAARRTMAGRPVVHGIHAVLWSLDSLLPAAGIPVPVCSVAADFRKMILVGDDVRLVRTAEPTPQKPVLKARIVAGGIAAVDLTIAFGEAATAALPAEDDPFSEPLEPIALSFEAMADRRGRTRLDAGRAEAVAQAFPAVAQALGPLRTVGLACSTYLVGMVCPGLHSIYGGFRFAVNAAAVDPALHFRVAASDERFRNINLAVAGYGWSGTIGAFARPEPVAQCDMAAVAARVRPGEFIGTNALILGGSRGLGELVAKIASAGGADVTLTYAVGEADARRVQAEIAAAGGRCEILRYDVHGHAGEQLSRLAERPSEAYYLASPQIFRRKDGSYDRSAFDDFFAHYVTGFHGFCRALRERFEGPIPVFYPSSLAVETRPANMTEYAMAKAAGEILCADLGPGERPGPILTRRLPRLPTDQTATLFAAEDVDAIDVMLPIVRAMREARG